MKTNTTLPIKLMAVLAALAILVSACNLTDVFAAPCASPALVVTKTEDTDDGLCSNTDCSLREAVINSNSCPGTQTIQIPAGTYSLTRSGADEDAAATGDLDITGSVVIEGQGKAVIDGNAADRIFDIKTGNTVSISGLTLQNGQTPLFGSAIANQGALVIDHVLLQDNHQTDKSGNGGAIFSYDPGSSLDISDSAVVNNWSAVDAAGLYNVAGSMTVDNVTVSKNHGYGVANAQGGTAQIKFSTIANDFGLYEIWNPGVGSAVRVGNSIIAGRATEGNCFQPVTSDGFNIDSAANGTTNTCHLAGPSDLTNTDPLLLALADNMPVGYNGGGTPTLALDPASPAINSADSTTCSAVDQRGVARPQGGKCDRGAFELENPPLRPTPTATQRPRADTPTPRPTSNAHSGPVLTFDANSNCRKGPGTSYFLVTPLKQGVIAAITGQNVDHTWVLVHVPASAQSCWVALALGRLSGSISDLPTLAAPPLPGTPASFNDSSDCGTNGRVVTLTWSITPNTDGYNLYRGGKLLTTLGAASISYDEDASAGKSFRYAIEAFNENGVSALVTTEVKPCP